MENREKRVKSPAQVLRVTIKGKRVQEKNSTETFLACIKILGPEKIASLQSIQTRGLPLVVSSKDNRLQMKPLDSKWFVCTHMSTKGKKSLLEQIAKQMRIKMEVEIL